MKKIFIITISAALLITASCKDNDFLDIEPRDVVPTDKMFSDPALVLSVVADLYQRQLDFSGLDNGWASFVDFSEAYPSENGSAFFVQRSNWGFSEWNTWDYGYIRDINLFIERATASTALNEGDKRRFIAEGRFLRASYYFELVKRMGGVPLITNSLTYEGDVESLQTPRSKESEVYDFILNELTAIKNDLPASSDTKSRASKGAAFAMMSRAALYAGSIAKYGATTPSVTLPGNEVGIPAAMANGYYAKALAAADSIIEGKAGSYSLYTSLPNLSDNFAAVFLDKSSTNHESIYIEDFKVGTNKVHSFTVNNQPYSRSEEGADAGRLNPSLNIVEAFEKLDNTYAPIPTTDENGDPIYYANQQDIFAGRDARLAGTVMLPGSIFKGAAIDVRAGYQNAAGDFVSSGNLPGTSTSAVGLDGPSDGLEFRTQTGFYIRKYLDPVTGSGRRGRRSDVAFIRYRYAEVLLNAAEASFELGDEGTALNYINQVRARAGLTTPLTSLSFDRIVHERRVELVFEGHTLFDMKRWRLAHRVWDGQTMTVADLKSNIGSATKHNTQPFSLWPYLYVNPGSPNNGKWIFREVKLSRVTGANRFQLGNYYSQISDDILSRNPKIVKQPNQ
ncbi:RagB/SusD family nutrient uptake outer membrane protein [Mucilaginibacter limnophilus]|uniref:RagB/SusD family nutrient uptake outer membrane protein n=1 Tax=Mucilaginibacter limnophilus TaxID=1932778 RepID=A0A437MI50_9SPHI|nr:RagB/SusD family nutrient uptake outer membrane protein [Mucilaginibacter limnophilus]RVT97303.1 RagB/SusD family nutrient uptake outer membrane protein [Mucilaginibacter limnophilus]